MKLKGKKVVLTGAASGIGRALLQGLSGHDLKLIAADIDGEKLRAAIAEFGSHDFYPFTCDLSVQDEVNRLFEFAAKTMKGIDIFIANAGIPYYEQISKPDWNHIGKIFETNVFSIIYSLEKMMRLSDRFHFVVTNSGMAKIAIPGYALYSSSKAALERFFEGYVLEKEPGIYVSMVYPIATKTDFFSRASVPPAPVPWPSQPPEKVASAVIKGIERDKKTIYPSRLLRLSQLPFVRGWYQRRERRCFQKWLQKRNQKC
ncbi:MAG: SDR family NAD(P)-dependent oxidoreductase [Candidatus Aminicenantes bacterium]|nr:SDR family NAD(P)-dependent oxidoreductase [Candidatus Aminicenantes bacterium]